MLITLSPEFLHACKPAPSSLRHRMQLVYMQAPKTAAMLLIECGMSAARALHDTKAKGNILEAYMSILHTYALEGADCAHEVVMMCTKVCLYHFTGRCHW